MYPALMVPWFHVEDPSRFARLKRDPVPVTRLNANSAAAADPAIQSASLRDTLLSVRGWEAPTENHFPGFSRSLANFQYSVSFPASGGQVGENPNLDAGLHSNFYTSFSGGWLVLFSWFFAGLRGGKCPVVNRPFVHEPAVGSRGAPITFDIAAVLAAG